MFISLSLFTGTIKDLLAYKKGFALSMQIFNLSKTFSPDERYSLTDEITDLQEALRKLSRSL